MPKRLWNVWYRPSDGRLRPDDGRPLDAYCWRCDRPAALADGSVHTAPHPSEADEAVCLCQDCHRQVEAGAPIPLLPASETSPR